VQSLTEEQLGLLDQYGITMSNDDNNDKAIKRLLRLKVSGKWNFE
jgi:hypothetical protein